MNFVFPMVLAAGAAAVAPVIIHVIVRTRPRRVVFPALQFVRKTHQANISKLRLKHLILLALRMLALLLFAALVARAQIPHWRKAKDVAVATAAVVVLDDSGSMSATVKGQSNFSRAQEMARALVEALPDGSRIAVMSRRS